MIRYFLWINNINNLKIFKLILRINNLLSLIVIKNQNPHENKFTFEISISLSNSNQNDDDYDR